MPRSPAADRGRRAGPGRRPAVRALLAVLALTAAAACGSRLPARDFTTGATPGGGRAPLRVGIIASATSPVGSTAFTGPRDGALAYFGRLNAQGGVAGRRVEVHTCDDGGSGVGNSDCVHRLVDEVHVAALVATTSLDYAGAPRVSAAGVPDIGGQPIGDAYETYPHLYSLYGSLAPRHGTPGWGGRLYGGTEVYRYFKQRQGARTAAVVSYNQASSAAYARLVTRGLEKEGYRVVPEQVDFALPDFRAAAADIKAHGADLVFDAIDGHGNAALCQAMDQVGARVTAKVTNVQNWSSDVASAYRSSPRCRNSLWVTGSSRNYEDTGQREVHAFREAVKGRKTIEQWQLEGWAAALWFTDAARSCAAAPGGATRGCLDRFMNRPVPYTARGLLLPVVFRHLAKPPAERRACLSVARWRDGRGWVTQGDMDRTCFDHVPQLSYRP